MKSPRRPRLDVGAESHLPRSPGVLLLVDVINPLDFPQAHKLSAGAVQAAAAIARLKKRLHRRGCHAIYANDNYGRWRSDFRETLGRCLQQGGASAELAGLLTPTPEDIVILKPRHSAFLGTPLNLLLTQMHTHTLVLVGFAADICVQLTAMDASLHGYQLWVPADCTAAESPRHKREALDYMARVLKADTRPSTQRRVLNNRRH